MSKPLYIRTRTDCGFSDTKNASSIRIITLDNKIIDNLKYWQEAQKIIG